MSSTVMCSTFYFYIPKCNVTIQSVSSKCPILFLAVKVVVGGPPGQKVSAQRLPKEGESGRIDGPVPLQTTLIVAMAMQ